MRTIDVVRVNGWHFVTAGGIGLPVSIIETVEKLRRGPKGSRVMARLTGSGLYALAMFYHTFFAARLARTVEVRIGTQFESLPLYALLIANMSTIGRYMRVAPEAHVADGHLRVVTFGAQSPWHLATAAMRTLNGSHGGAASVRTFTGRCVTLRTDTPTPFCADGETRLCDTSFKIEIVPNALSLICPL
jgi:diacylglycerol kinase family enzyme